MCTSFSAALIWKKIFKGRNLCVLRGIRIEVLKITCVFKSVLQTSSGFVNVAAIAPATAPAIKWDLNNVHFNLWALLA